MNPPIVEGYALHEQLAGDARREVWSATPFGTDAHVVVRILRAGQPVPPGVARLNHPNVLALLDAGTLDDGTPFSVHEVASGGSLARWRPSDWTAIAEVLAPLCAGLFHAHARGVVHAGLAPERLRHSTSADARPGLKISGFERASAGAFPVDGVEDRLALLGLIWSWTHGSPFEKGLEWQPRFAVPTQARDVCAGLRDARPCTLHTVVEQLGLDRQGLRHSAPTTAVAGLGARLLDHREPNLVGRLDERRALYRLLSTRRGFRLAALTGPPGVGRSRLVRWIARQANALGRRVLVDPSPAQARAAAERGPILVAIDPLREATRAVLDKLVFTGTDTLAVVSAERLPADSGIHRLPGLEELRLEPLPPATIRSILVGELGTDPVLALGLGHRSAGNPGLAIDWLRELARSGDVLTGPFGLQAREDPRTPPLDLAPFRERVHPLTQGEHALGFQLAALLGEKLDGSLWRRVQRSVGAPPVETRRAVSLGVLARDHDGWSWTHPHYRRAVAESLPDAALFHQAIATVLEREEPTLGHVVQRGLHLLAGGLVDQAWAVLVGWFDALATLDPELAVQVVHALLPHLDHAEPEHRLRLRLLQTSMRQTLYGAREALEIAVLLVQEGRRAPESLRQRAIHAAAQLYARAGQPTRALDLLARVPTTPEGLLTEALCHRELGRLDEAHAVLEDARDEAREPSVRARVEHELGRVCAAQELLEDARDHYATALDDTPRDHRHPVHADLALVLLQLDRLLPAALHGRLAVEQSHHAGPTDRAFYIVVCALAAARTDDLGLLAATGDRALQAVHRYPPAQPQLLIELATAEPGPRQAQSQAFLEALSRALSLPRGGPRPRRASARSNDATWAGRC